MDSIIIIYIIFGILPSLTWLAYYLRKDAHPEPKRTVLKIFIFGSLITIPVFFVQIGLKILLDRTGLDPTSLIYNIIYWFLIIAISEESFKFFVIKMKIMNSPDLDEPLDIMLYMVVAALGFSAVENVLYLFAPTGQMSFNSLVDRTVVISIIRFVGATFLHTLCSATIGYSLAISFYEVKKRDIIFIIGLIMATLLHGLYDFSIIILNGYLKLLVPAIIIVTLAFLVFSGFEKLKKMKGICKIN